MDMGIVDWTMDGYRNWACLYPPHRAEHLGGTWQLGVHVGTNGWVTHLGGTWVTVGWHLGEAIVHLGAT